MSELDQGSGGVGLDATEISAAVVWPGQNTEALATLTAGIVRVVPEGVDTNGGANLSAMAVTSPTSDTQTPTGTNIKALLAAAFGYVFDGTNFARARSIAAAVLAGTTQPFGQLVSPPGQWAISNQPAVNTAATVSKAAGAAGVRHILTALTATLTTDAAVAAHVILNVRDGATGAGTVIWTGRLAVPAVANSMAQISLSGLNIVGTAATAMTIEFTAAGGANTFESVAASGWSTV